MINPNYSFPIFANLNKITYLYKKNYENIKKLFVNHFCINWFTCT